MAGWDRNATPPGGQGGTTITTTGPSSTTTGPSSSTSTTSQNSRTSESSSSVRNLSETTDRSVNSVVRTENMDPASLAALRDLIASLSEGGTPEQQAMAHEIITQIDRSRGQEWDYSKQAAFNDATRVAASTSEQALKDMMPTITAGIDSAGTSGSAMSALLAQEAANNAADLAARLSLETSIQYGQIKNQALANTTNLLGLFEDTQNRTVDQLLEALNVAKGSVVTQTSNTRDVTRRTATETSQSQGSSSSSGSSTQLTLNSGGTNTNSGSTQTQTYTPNQTLTGGAGISTMSNLSTPSSFSSGNRTNPYVTIV